MKEPTAAAPKTTSFDDLKVKKKGRRSVRKYVVAAVLGILLGLGAVVFFARVYNPFEEGLGERSLLIATPPDADLVLYLPHVPEVMGRLRERGFVKTLEESRGFQEFLGSDFARSTGALEALRKAFQELDRLRAERPLGLELLGDVTGEQVVVAAWQPEAPGKPWDFLLTFKPQSWLVLAGVNVAVDQAIADRFLKDRVEKAGVKLEHARDSASVTTRDGRTYAFARVRDAVLVGTRATEVARLKTRLERERLPDEPAERYRALNEGAATAWTEIRALVRRDAGDAQLGFTARLNELWGANDVLLLKSLLPRLGGEDLVATLRVDDDLVLRLKAPEGRAAADDLSPAYQPFSKGALDRHFADDAPYFPASTFAYARFDFALQRFLSALFKRPELFSPADLSNLRDGFATMPEFGTIEGFVDRVAESCDGGAALAFFTQDRAGVATDARTRPTPGYALALSVRDESSVRGLLETMRERVRLGGASGKRQVVRDLVATKSGDFDVYELSLPDGLLDDPTTTKFGFALARGRFLFTNWAPALADLGSRLAGTAPSAVESVALRNALAYAPEDVRTAWALDGKALFAWMDQSVDAWAAMQTAESGKKQILWNAEAERQARGAGLKPGSPEYADAINKAYDRLRNAEISVRRPELKRRIQTYLDQLRGTVDAVGLFVGGRSEVEFGTAIRVVQTR